MSIPWWIPFFSGFEDGLNPCVLVSSAVLIFLYLLFSRCGLKFSLIGIFIISLFLSNLTFGIGVFQGFLSGDLFVGFAKGAYVILGVFLLVLGILFFDGWLKIIQGKEVHACLINKLLNPCQDSNLLSRFLIGLIVFLSAVLMGLISTLWPMNGFMLATTANMYMPGQMPATLLVLSLYFAVQLWMVALISLLISWKKLTMRLRHIICAAIFLSAAVSVVYIFYL